MYTGAWPDYIQSYENPIWGVYFSPEVSYGLNTTPCAKASGLNSHTVLHSQSSQFTLKPIFMGEKLSSSKLMKPDSNGIQTFDNTH